MNDEGSEKLEDKVKPKAWAISEEVDKVRLRKRHSVYFLTDVYDTTSIENVVEGLTGIEGGEWVPGKKDENIISYYRKDDEKQKRPVAEVRMGNAEAGTYTIVKVYADAAELTPKPVEEILKDVYDGEFIKKVVEGVTGIEGGEWSVEKGVMRYYRKGDEKQKRPVADVKIGDAEKGTSTSVKIYTDATELTPESVKDMLVEQVFEVEKSLPRKYEMEKLGYREVRVGKDEFYYVHPLKTDVLNAEGKVVPSESYVDDFNFGKYKAVADSSQFVLDESETWEDMALEIAEGKGVLGIAITGQMVEGENRLKVGENYIIVNEPELKSDAMSAYMAAKKNGEQITLFGKIGETVKLDDRETSHNLFQFNLEGVMYAKK